MSNTHVKNIKLGACKVSFGGVDLGYTKGGVQVEVATETLKVTVDQLGQTVISELVQGRNITITAPLAESVLQNMVDLMPGSTLSEDDSSVTITSAQGVIVRSLKTPARGNTEGQNAAIPVHISTKITSRRLCLVLITAQNVMTPVMRVGIILPTE